MSGKVYAYIAFSYLTAATAFLIGWLMHIRITSFALVAVINEWDLDEKAAACGRAGLMYLALAVCLSLYSAYWHYRARLPPHSHYEVELSDMRERLPLLYSTVFEGEDVSHSTGGFRLGGGYGSNRNKSSSNNILSGSHES